MPPPDGATNLLLASVPAALALMLRGFVIAGEVAANALGVERARELIEERPRAARAILKLKDDYEQTAASTRAFTALCLAGSTALFSGIFIGMNDYWGLGVHVLLAAILGAGVVWLFTALTDVIPRSLAAMHPEPWALGAAPFLVVVRSVLAPLTRVVIAVADLVLRPFGAKVRFTQPPPPLEELERLLSTSAHEGAPEPALVRSLFEFGDRTVKEIMVPRIDMHAIAIDAKPDEVVQFFVEEGHTRVPVYRGTLDTIVGIVHVKDLLPLLANPELIILHDLVRPTLFVPWNKPIAKVMRELQKGSQHFAVVVDEYGGVAGIVTLEDIVEQIVGDIRDEFDEVDTSVTAGHDGASLVRADMRIGEFNDAFHAEVPAEEGYETLGGFLNSLAGAIPSEGDRFYHGGFEFEVTQRDPRRVLEVRVTRTRNAPAGTETRA